MNDIYSVFELINNDDSKNFINIKRISKQYLAYYIYRIITKYINYVEMGCTSGDIDEFNTYLRIPTQHNRQLNYPLAGKMTQDDEILDLIILKGIDMFTKTDKYIKSLPNGKAYEDMYSFLKQKSIETIIKDLMDLQSLIPGLSVPQIRQNYINNSDI